MQTQLVESYSGPGYTISQFKTGELAVLSYLVESSGSALLIDPTIDISAYASHLKKTGSEVKYILLTHFHADYVSGHLEYKVPVVMGPGAKLREVGFEVRELKDGESVPLGYVKVVGVATPGHTLESVSYLLEDKEGNPRVLFTGDTLFLGEVGRPDLAVNSEHNVEELAATLFDSLQKIKKLDGKLTILPGHGSGSACGKSIGDGNSCTLEKQLENNYALKIHNREEFVKILVGSLAPPPQYFSHDSSLNRQGPTHFHEQVKLSSTPLSVDQYKQYIAKGHPVVDTRTNIEHVKEGYIKGAFLLPDGGTLSTWAGNLFDPKKQLLIFAEKEKGQEIAERLARVGYRALGANNFTIKEWAEKGGEITIPKFASIAEMKEVPNKLVLDVRSEAEAQAGHIEGSLNIPFAKLHAEIAKVPKGNPIYVHCRVGYRARIGASILAQHGIDSIILPVKFEEFGQAGLPIVK